MERYTLYVHIAPNDKKYFGITKNIKNRWCCNGVGYKSQQLFWRAIQKYGWNNFQHIILLTNLSKNWACKLEQDYIREYQTNNPKYGYNITSGGDGTLGHKLSEEAIDKIRKAHLGKKLSTEHKLKISKSEKGKKISSEQKQKISRANKGRKLSKEHIQKLSESHKGYIMPDEQKEKIRQSNIGKVRTKKQRDNISRAKKGKPASRKGYHLTDAQKQMISIKNKQHWAESKMINPNYSRCIKDSTRKKLSEAGKKAHINRTNYQVSDETRRKMSESQKLRWEKKRNEIKYG